MSINSTEVAKSWEKIERLLREYEMDGGRVQVWKQSISQLIKYTRVDQTFPQKIHNFLNGMTQNITFNPQFVQFVYSNIKVLNVLYLMIKEHCQSIDEAISHGKIKHIIFNTFKQHHHCILKHISSIVELIAIHILQLFEGRKAARQHGNLFVDLHSFLNNGHQHIQQAITRKPMCVLQNFMTFTKPALKYYLNIDTILETSRPSFEHKKALVSGFLETEDELSLRMSKVINLNEIIHATVKGNEMINRQFDSFNFQLLFEQQSDKVCSKWSMITCIHEESQKLKIAFEKLPFFIRPKSNLDALSYLREQYLPTFRFHVIEEGFWEGPFISEFVTVYYNCGQSQVVFLSFTHLSEELKKIKYFHSLTQLQQLQLKGLQFGKVVLKPDDFLVVGIGKGHILYVKDTQRANLLQWNVLPKDGSYIDDFLKITQVKQSYLKHQRYFLIPKWILLLDLLNHDFNNLDQVTFAKPIQELQSHLRQQDNKLLTLMKEKRSFTLSQKKIPSYNRFCEVCHLQILNYYLQNQQGQIRCLDCGLDSRCRGGVHYIYNPESLYFPMVLWRMLKKKRKIVIEKEKNKYEGEVCSSQFIGAITEQGCFGHKQSMQKASRHFMNNYQSEDLYFGNMMRELGLCSSEEMIMEKSQQKEKDEQKRKSIMKQIRWMSKWIKNKNKLILELSRLYEAGNMVYEAMWVLNDYKEK